MAPRPRRAIRSPNGGWSRIREGPGPHSHPEDIFYVLEGTMSLLVDGEWTHASKGSFVLVPGGVTHDFANRSDARACGCSTCRCRGDFGPADARHRRVVHQEPAGGRGSLVASAPSRRQRPASSKSDCVCSWPPWTRPNMIGVRVTFEQRDPSGRKCLRNRLRRSRAGRGEAESGDGLSAGGLRAPGWRDSVPHPVTSGDDRLYGTRIGCMRRVCLGPNALSPCRGTVACPGVSFRQPTSEPLLDLQVHPD